MDDGNVEDLRQAVQRSIEYYRGQPSGRVFRFGRDEYSARELAGSYQHFLTILALSGPVFREAFQRDFVVVPTPGADGDGIVVCSAYYEHELPASLQRTSRFRFPLYGRPEDLREETRSNGERRVYRERGGGRAAYYTRREIDSKNILKGRGLEIAWADDPVHIFFLQVQGSGWLRLPDGRRLRVRYAGNNGHPYRSVGGYMIQQGLLTRQTFSRKAMVEYLETHESDRQEILNQNPRYVFFKIDRGPNRSSAYGSLNVPLTPRRSVALDPQTFPQGALGWMETHTKNSVQRFVLNQDEGGAIKGPGRLDYFVGGGPEGEAYAINFWEKGRFFLVVKRRGGMKAGNP